MSFRLSHDAVAWDVNRNFRLLSASLYHAAKSTDPLSPCVSLWSAKLDAVIVQKVSYLSNNIRPSSCMPPKWNLESLSALVSVNRATWLYSELALSSLGGLRVKTQHRTYLNNWGQDIMLWKMIFDTPLTGFLVIWGWRTRCSLFVCFTKCTLMNLPLNIALLTSWEGLKNFG